MRLLSKKIFSLAQSFKTFVQIRRNMANILDGLALATTLNQELKSEINAWINLGNRKPHLACILVGDDPASAKYVSNKEKAAGVVGIDCTVIKMERSVPQDDLIAKVKDLNENPNIDGILVQLPLPHSIDERSVCNSVCPDKDVDGFHIENVGKFSLDMDSMLPCTAIGVIEILRRYYKENKMSSIGKNAVVIGRSKNVGMPIAMLLHTDGRHQAHNGMDTTVTICHRFTPPDQLELFCLNADIIVSAAGVPKLIRADMVKPGAIVVDVGLSQINDPITNKPKLVGDVDFDEVSQVAGAITPVPGGVGPMTVAMLMRNTLKAAKIVAGK